MAAAPRLPDYRGGQVAALRGARAPASTINRVASTPRDRSLTVAAEGEYIPLTYGRDNVPGRLFAWGLIGTDLVLGYIHCIGEIDAVEMIQIGDADASTITGVSTVSYVGTPTQDADPWLAEAIPAYSDRMRIETDSGWRGIAYSVIRIPESSAEEVGDLKNVRATVRGRKIYDPRTGLTAYSDNSALCMADLITDPDYGLGRPVLGLSEAADWCDSLLADGATKRCRLSLTTYDPVPVEPDLLSVLSTYAECWYVYEAGGIRLVPDSLVDLESAPRITDILAGSISLRDSDELDAPNEIEITYKVPRADALSWNTAAARRKIVGSERPSPTSVRMNGVFQSAEADNKAISRLNRVRNRRQVSYTGFDADVVRQIGDVVNLWNAPRGIDIPMRIESVSLAGPGRYQVSGHQYDASHYPDEIPEPGAGSVPAGGILPFVSAEIPADWARMEDADGRVIVGAGGTLSQGQIGGAAAWVHEISGTTTASGAHEGTADIVVVRHDPTPTEQEPSFAAGDQGDPVHLHTFSTGQVALTPPIARLKLIEAQTTQVNAPLGALVFGLPGIISANWTRTTDRAGRLVESGQTVQNTGTFGPQIIEADTDIADDTHAHHVESFGTDVQAYGQWDPAFFFGEFWISFPIYRPKVSGGPHSHHVSLTVALAVKSRKIAVYAANRDAPIVPGHIILWRGGSPPTGWVLCDGTNGTPDMRDYFVVLADAGEEGVQSGDNTIRTTGTTQAVSHSHQTNFVVYDRKNTVVPHKSSISHNHSIDKTDAFTPPFYALAFIMFAPGA